ncbi:MULTISPECIES: helix-turn-helix transcriptional regulator [Pseudomonadota]|jgi:DNA-binding XRE family transcriptional regulator|uniref:helix-turn-helix domain-containing protein n=2 Tax=Pseudomonadota TaxID=1224 RepID=UPI000826BC3E|nr:MULTISPECIES: helix-turn-helix transcriptional regulator [Pseudomonadota]MAF62093.1 XRE family transcriptional regulator [Blastomonas sp.]|tara:strand:+ start:40762 stop:41145 length:384 start_codon:yes stop_codon:yes gene_type:complete
MGYEPQHFTAPDGTRMVVLTAAEFERLRELAEDAEDVIAATLQLERMRQGEQGVPGEVVGLMLNDGLSPIAAWRKFRGLSQADLAAKSGCSQVWLSKIESGAARGTAKLRRAIAKALDAPLWSIEDD